MKILNFFRKRKSVFLIKPLNDTQLDSYEIYKYVKTIHQLRAVYTLFSSAANRINFQVIKNDEIDKAYTNIFDGIAGQLFADWFVIGEAHISTNFSYLSFDDDVENAIVVKNINPPLSSAKSLIFKLIEFERAQQQAFYLAGATNFAVPVNQTIIPTPNEIEQARKILQKSIREAGVGGVEILPANFEFKSIQNTLEKSNFDKLSVMLLRELCNLVGIDSSLLNDPENKTYSNKTEAQKMFFVNIIIPQIALFISSLNLALWSNGMLEYYIKYDTSAIESLSENKLQLAELALKLFNGGIITKEEAREFLDLQNE